MPFQYHFITQEYHLVPFLSGFHYPEVSAEYGNETLSINGLRGQISNKTILHRADTSYTIKISNCSFERLLFFMAEMKPVKAFASCTARCASYGAAVLHILRHCRKMLHKSTSSQAMPQSLQTITDDYRQGDEKNLSVLVCICPYLSVCKTQ